MGKATTDLFEGLVSKVKWHGTGIDFDYIGEYIIVLIGVICYKYCFFIYSRIYNVRIAQKVSYNFRKEISEKINRMPLKYFDTKDSWRSIIKSY